MKNPVRVAGFRNSKFVAAYVIEITLDLIKRLQADPAFKDFVLVGGTALALQIGHRRSIDIDLFTDSPFDTKSLSETQQSRKRR